MSVSINTRSEGHVFEGGFANPVMDSQGVFRRVMNALGEPGTVADLSGFVTPPAPLSQAAAAILLTLADYDTPVWFEKPENNDDAIGWMSFHTGAPRTADVFRAAFAVLEKMSPVEAWAKFPIGTSDYPDRSATLILPVESLAGGEPLRLTGPGIETEKVITPLGLPQGFEAFMTENRAAYPLGLDVLLVCGGEAIGLPRTTRIEEA
ncbi:alpha-D-ribose 1-methylphosphonate 5-triphosphate synthase subunit PhnH [Neorhizobium huautlense]|uniref:Alpha-D-ribose 1-methylphosphonate 5-triphosphate synthase subunit PhnH n=1 Tax=Neorhizobium huautlense TaxID=67774 RepID=A0ABT9PPQ1_9HYPH|nr:phosphonate C-P lyase system protein PhnH [Neorhizobium huautlense]MDP9836445.1 alpha-D-ribose 1-methylphosphonate 5-triphosphate synthase subunit PhnH [Neorhizobium huautlense]